MTVPGNLVVRAASESASYPGLAADRPGVDSGRVEIADHGAITPSLGPRVA
jgi:hypothetical protein